MYILTAETLYARCKAPLQEVGTIGLVRLGLGSSRFFVRARCGALFTKLTMLTMP
jgi:hypothetical protein